MPDLCPSNRPFMHPNNQQPHFTLSEREKEIIGLLAEGLSSKLIANHLGLSKHTVDTHRRNLIRKTGAKNTLELAAYCVKAGIV
ncbi:MAG: helix-turn-helix transcriptional regulator [Saprospiraceae bacterium]|nr:helix-turn-helix transcriptional regulator [Saprospiraceae bacterium]